MTARRRDGVSVEAMRARIREAGLRVTAPRVAVLRQLLAASSPVTHAALSEALAPAGWDRATLYRNLIDLTDAGILQRADVGDHVWRFEVRAGNASGAHAEAQHPHFVCGDCGDVVCLPIEAVHVSGGRGLPKSLGTGVVEIQVKGLCDRCA